MKVDTMLIQGKEYAKVPQRLKAFREANPRASVETKPTMTESGTLIFEARIISDKSDPSSASATGHSYGEASGDKAFEKLETISVGRALAMLGYLNNGQVATTEEMQEFEEYQQDQYQQAILDVHAATKREEFAEILGRLNAEQKKLATPIINQRIKELRDGNTDTSRAAE